MQSRYSSIPKDILHNPEILRLVLPGLRASFKMYESYHYISGDPLDCDITAFGGLQDHSASQEDLEAWCQQTKRSFTLHMLPGKHMFIHSEREHLLRCLSGELSGVLSRFG